MNTDCWCDAGAGKNNVGGVLYPMGCGVVRFDDGKLERELSVPLQPGTNQEAELHAVRLALESLRERRAETRLRIYTDSKYAIGVLRLGWKPKKYQELIRQIKALAAECEHFSMRHVKGHAGNPYQERAHELAAQAQAAASEQEPRKTEAGTVTAHAELAV